ncbi:MAG: hypothetical protein IKT25_08450 [Firmicutes bacterium]|nr:hypothetical protein [Bacillota bacterium]
MNVLKERQLDLLRKKVMLAEKERIEGKKTLSRQEARNLLRERIRN